MLQDPAQQAPTQVPIGPPPPGGLTLSDGLPGHQQWVALALASLMLIAVVELVRKRKLREEYSLIWIGTALILMVLAWQYPLLDHFRRLIGAVEPTSALFFGALVFLMLVALQFSVRLSKLTWRNRMLSQRVALLDRELQELREQTARPAAAEGAESRGPAESPGPGPHSDDPS